MKEQYAAALFCVCLHELSHLAALMLCGCKKAVAELFPGGIRIRAEGSEGLGYLHSAFCAAAAPAVNLAAGVLFLLLLKRNGSELFRNAAAVNFVTGAVNLLPLSYMDGGRVLNDLLSYKSALPPSERFTRTVDRVVLALIGAAALIPCFFGKGNIFLLVFFGYNLFTSVIINDKIK